jgi:hypothetical protein
MVYVSLYNPCISIIEQYHRTRIGAFNEMARLSSRRSWLGAWISSVTIRALEIDGDDGLAAVHHSRRASAKLCFPNKSGTSSGRATRLGWIRCPTNPRCVYAAAPSKCSLVNLVPYAQLSLGIEFKSSRSHMHRHWPLTSPRLVHRQGDEPRGAAVLTEAPCRSINMELQCVPVPQSRWMSFDHSVGWWRTCTHISFQWRSRGSHKTSYRAPPRRLARRQRTRLWLYPPSRRVWPSCPRAGRGTSVPGG